MSDELGSTYAKRLGAIRRDLLWVCDRWEDVHEMRLKGTARPWREPTISAEARAEMDALAKAERIDREGFTPPPPGESPAPVHVDILDTLATILMRSDMLAEHVAGTLGIDRLDHAPSAFADATPYLRFVGEHLGEFVEDDPDGMDAVSDVARELKAEMSQVLGEISDGQTLKALCPFCGGKDDTHPVGGAHTLRVRLIWMPTSEDRDAHEAAIICTGGSCEPSEAECGKRVRGLPVWPIAEWEWLAARFEQSA